MFDYIDGAAEDEVTLRRSIAGFADYEFVPRVLRDVSLIDTSTTLLGKPISFPFVVAPTGFTRIAHSQGELAVAQASERTGIPYCLSTMGTRSIEEVAQVNHASKWFQVYVWKDRGLVRELLERSAAAGYEAICITVDLARLGRRERDIRRGFTLPPKIGLDTIFDTVRRPSWTVDFLRGGPIVFANLTTRHKRSEAGADTSYSSAAGTEAVDLARFVAAQLDSSLNWDDIAWFREIWKGPIVIKGIQCTDDARIAAELGDRRCGLIQPRRPPTRRLASADKAAAASGRSTARRHRADPRRRRTKRVRHHQGVGPGSHHHYGRASRFLRTRCGRSRRCRDSLRVPALRTGTVDGSVRVDQHRRHRARDDRVHSLM